jgi:hypothetical protein
VAIVCHLSGFPDDLNELAAAVSGLRLTTVGWESAVASDQLLVAVIAHLDLGHRHREHARPQLNRVRRAGRGLWPGTA